MSGIFNHIRKLRAGILIAVFFAAWIALGGSALADKSGWQGVDEAVIEKFAGEHGRKPVEPIIGKENGDLLLFVFLIAGAAGGFAAGYYWRVLISDREKSIRPDPSLAKRGTGETDR